MLVNATQENLRALRLHGMLNAFQELQSGTALGKMTPEEVVGIIVDREVTDRDNRKMKRRLKTADFRQEARIEDIDWTPNRGLDRAVMMGLASGSWIQRHQNVIFCGPAGTGKTWLACALGEKACRMGYKTRFVRFPRLFTEISVARIEGNLTKYYRDLAKTDLLILDDWGQSLSEQERRDLFEIIEDRNDRSSTIITSQLPISNWHEAIGDPTIADAILDRLIHRAHNFSLHGSSLRAEQMMPKSQNEKTKKIDDEKLEKKV